VYYGAEDEEKKFLYLQKKSCIQSSAAVTAHKNGLHDSEINSQTRVLRAKAVMENPR